MHVSAQDLRWQSGTTRCLRIRRLVITDDEAQGQQLAERRDTAVVATPRELMFLLAGDHRLVATVVLAGRFAFDDELAALVHAECPELGVERLGAN